MREKIANSEVKRGFTVALISIGMTFMLLSPIIVMQVISNIIK